MKISYNWLKEFIDINESPEHISDLLTKAGLEVEKVEKYESVKGGLEGVVIGEVLECERIPETEKLKKTKVNIGHAVLPIVCGAPNVAVGQKIVVATVGTTLYPSANEPLKISKAKIRGEVSEGMICAEDELGLGKSHDGIIVLPADAIVGTPASEVFNIYTDTIFEIGLTPNRADAASHLGVARDLKVLLNRPLKDTLKNSIATQKQSAPVEIVIEEKEGCLRYAGLTISNIAVKQSPQWLKEKLKALGLSSINNIVDVTNYILHDLGQPLHAFDLEEVKGNKIIVKTVQEGTPFVTLDGVERKLKASDLMICNAAAPMCIAGVFGGETSGVKESTKSIFLESAYFSPDYVRKSSLNHGLKTDSSFRFERGTDPNMVLKALVKAAELIVELAGGEISSSLIDLYPAPISDFELETTYKKINNLIGKELEGAEIDRILKGLDIKIDKEGDKLKLSVPSYRVDVKREADIVEEVLRIYGYDNIEIAEYLSTSYIADFPEKEKDKMFAIISQILSANGFNEIITNSLTKPGYAGMIGAEGSSVNILNRLSEDLGVLRQSLLFSGLEVILYNINRRQKDLKFFELGKTYNKKESGYKERNNISLFFTGSKTHESWLNKTAPVDFFDLKKVLGMIMDKFNFKNLSATKTTDPIFSQGLEYQLNNKALLKFGLVSEKILKKLDIKQTVLYADIDFDYLVSAYKPQLVYSEVSKFPEVRRDLSLVIDKSVNFEHISQVAQKTERKMLQDINIFDVYEGENIGEGKKSYSVSFILQDYEQTLTDKAIDKTMERLMAAFEKELGAVIRK
jgi:phenylalanyl-tRNA synthetase beta chain